MGRPDDAANRRRDPHGARRRRRAVARGWLRVAWNRSGPRWRMHYRLPDGFESTETLGPAWVNRDAGDPKGWTARRGRPPEGFLTEADAAAHLRAFLDKTGKATPPDRVLFDQVLNAYLEHCGEKGLSPTTMRTYRQIVDEVRARWGADPADPQSSGWRVVDVDIDELEDYRDDLVEERGLAGSTLNQRRSVLAGVFKIARRRFRVSVDPMDGFERAAVKDAGDLEVYAVEEVWALVRCLQSGQHHPPAERQLSSGELAARARQDRLDAVLVTVAALCGLRRSELIGLRWRAVLFEQRSIIVRRGYTDVGGDRLPKGQRVHSVPMAPQVHDMLLALRPPGADPEDRVFPGEAGGPMDGSALYRRFKLAQAAAGVRPLRFHDLRHTFGTQAIAAGANVHDVQQWMGHRHLTTTMRYVHYRPQQAAADLLGRRFMGTAGELVTFDHLARQPEPGHRAS